MSRAPACPICKQLAQPEFRPFCSKRCADVDLGRWLKGSYVVAGQDGEADDVSSDGPREEPSEDDEAVNGKD